MTTHPSGRRLSRPWIARLDSLPTPALILDLDKVEANIERMAAKAEALGVRLRPHLKTHKCAEVARLQLERSGAGATVSTLEEARYFADHGIDDLTWAFPVILSRLDEVAALAERVTLRVVLDSSEALDALEGLERPLSRPLHVWLKVDCGYHRAGVDPEGEPAITPRPAPRGVSPTSSSTACSATPGTPTAPLRPRSRAASPTKSAT